MFRNFGRKIEQQRRAHSTSPAPSAEPPLATTTPTAPSQPLESAEAEVTQPAASTPPSQPVNSVAAEVTQPVKQPDDSEEPEKVAASESGAEANPASDFLAKAASAAAAVFGGDSPADQATAAPISDAVSEAVSKTESDGSLGSLGSLLSDALSGASSRGVPSLEAVTQGVPSPEAVTQGATEVVTAPLEVRGTAKPQRAEADEGIEFAAANHTIAIKGVL